MEDAFFSELMQQLSGYALKNQNNLPGSFTENNLSDLYLRLKLSGSELSPAMNELLLFTLNRKQMHKEIVDFCSQQKNNSDINKYYLAESLLQSKLQGKSYSEALSSSQVFNNQQD